MKNKARQNKAVKNDFEQLFKLYNQMVFRLALARLSNRAAAEDVMGEVFLRLVKYDPEFKDDQHQKAWFIKATVNQTKSYFTSAEHRHRGEALTAELAAEEKETFPEVLQAVWALELKYKTVVHLFYYEDMTTSEIAAALGITVSAVKQRLSRARAMLKETLTGDDF